MRFGNELEISGAVFSNGKESHTILFPETSFPSDLPVSTVISLSHEGWKELLHQLDTLGIEGLNKVVLRKSQRQIEQNVSWNVFRRDNYTCQYCGRNDVPLTVDHVVLWENMGDSVENNLISACRKCNKTRGNMSFEDWLKDKYLLANLKKAFPLRVDKHIEGLRKFGEDAKKCPLRKTERSKR